MNTSTAIAAMVTSVAIPYAAWRIERLYHWAQQIRDDRRLDAEIRELLTEKGTTND